MFPAAGELILQIELMAKRIQHRVSRISHEGSGPSQGPSTWATWPTGESDERNLPLGFEDGDNNHETLNIGTYRN